MAKIYTRMGDAGETSLLGGGRVRKDDLRIEAIGSVDEANAALGAARAELARGEVAPPELDLELSRIQHHLFDLGAELAAPTSDKTRQGALCDTDVAALEAAIDRYEAGLEPLREFILPGGAPAASQLHVARCVSRRCERRLFELAASEAVRGELLRYVNRLSDFLFVAARAVNKACGVPDVVWEHGARGRG
ncbi:MAG TPA: cob(I)yrinic acid a,c-diamide adenosyltransferase [Lacipirellulaceae bacterium]|nr:cob(I)yrinic acid a,c-diamide adenosyltransferase [Lacipirellulaceae bacterium]